MPAFRFPFVAFGTTAGSTCSVLLPASLSLTMLGLLQDSEAATLDGMRYDTGATDAARDPDAAGEPLFPSDLQRGRPPLDRTGSGHAMVDHEPGPWCGRHGPQRLVGLENQGSPQVSAAAAKPTLFKEGSAVQSVGSSGGVAAAGPTNTNSQQSRSREWDSVSRSGFCFPMHFLRRTITAPAPPAPADEGSRPQEQHHGATSSYVSTPLNDPMTTTAPPGPLTGPDDHEPVPVPSAPLNPMPWPASPPTTTSPELSSSSVPAPPAPLNPMPRPSPPTSPEVEVGAQKTITISAAEQFCRSILDTKNTLQHLSTARSEQCALSDEERELEDALYKAAFGPLFAEAVAQDEEDRRRRGVGGRDKEKTGSQSILLPVEALEYFTKKQALHQHHPIPLLRQEWLANAKALQEVSQERLAKACANALQEAYRTSDQNRDDTTVEYEFLYPQTSQLHQQGGAGGAEEALWYQLFVTLSPEADASVAAVYDVTQSQILDFLERERSHSRRISLKDSREWIFPHVELLQQRQRDRGTQMSAGASGSGETKSETGSGWLVGVHPSYREIRSVILPNKLTLSGRSVRQTKNKIGKAFVLNPSLAQQSPAKTSADRMIVDQQVAGHPAVRGALETYFSTLRNDISSVLGRCNVRADAFGSAVSGFATGTSDIDYSFTPELPENSDNSDTTTRCILHTTGRAGNLPVEFFPVGSSAPSNPDGNYSTTARAHPVLNSHRCVSRSDWREGVSPFDAFVYKFELLENLAREMIQGTSGGVILRQASTGDVWMKWSSLKIDHDSRRNFVLGEGKILVRQELLDRDGPAASEVDETGWLSFKMDLTVNNFGDIARQKLLDTQLLAVSHPTVRNVGRMFFAGAKERAMVGTSHKLAYEVMPTFRHFLAFMQFLVQEGYYSNSTSTATSFRLELVTGKRVPAEETLLLQFLEYFRGILQTPTMIGDSSPRSLSSTLVRVVRNEVEPSSPSSPSRFVARNPWKPMAKPMYLDSSLSLWTRDPWLWQAEVGEEGAAGKICKFIDPAPRLQPALEEWAKQLLPRSNRSPFLMNGNRGAQEQPTGSSSTEKPNRAREEPTLSDSSQGIASPAVHGPQQPPRQLPAQFQFLPMPSHAPPTELGLQMWCITVPGVDGGGTAPPQQNTLPSDMCSYANAFLLPGNFTAPFPVDAATVTRAFNLRPEAFNLRPVPDTLILTAGFSDDVAQRVRDACAQQPSLKEWVKQFHAGTRAAPPLPMMQPDGSSILIMPLYHPFTPVRALRKALQTVADVLGLQLADREQELERKRQRFQPEKNDQGETVRRTGEVDWKQRAVAWRQGLRGNNVVGQDNLPLMPGAFSWKGKVRSNDNGTRSTSIMIVSVEGAPQWVQEALDACWVAAAESSDMREVRPAHYAEIVHGPGPVRAQWQFADGVIGGTHYPLHL